VKQDLTGICGAFDICSGLADGDPIAAEGDGGWFVAFDEDLADSGRDIRIQGGVQQGENEKAEGDEFLHVEVD
jgi:hypothetical protein